MMKLRCRIDSLCPGMPMPHRTFQNDMTTFKIKDEVLTRLVHLGHLTYDEQKSEVFIPDQL